MPYWKVMLLPEGQSFFDAGSSYVAVNRTPKSKERFCCDAGKAGDMIVKNKQGDRSWSF